MKRLTPISEHTAHLLCAELESAIAAAQADRAEGYFVKTNTGLIDGFTALHAELCKRGNITRPLPGAAA